MASKYAEIIIRVYDSRSKVPSKLNHNARLELNSTKKLQSVRVLSAYITRILSRQKRKRNKKQIVLKVIQQKLIRS